MPDPDGQEVAVGEIATPVRPTADGRGVLRAALRSRRAALAGSSVLACLHQTGEALVPVLIGVVVDRAVDGGSPAELAGWLAVLAADFVLLSGSFRWGSRLGQRTAELVAHDLRGALVRKVLDPGGGARNGLLSGEVSSIAVQDARRVGALHMMLPLAVAAVAAIAVSAVALLWSSVVLGALVLLGTPPLLWATRRMARPLEAGSAAEQQDAALASAVATDLVRGLRVLRGIGAEDAAVARYAVASRRSLGAAVRAGRAGALLDGGVQAATGLFIALVAGVGGWLALSGSVSIGGLIAAVGLAQFLLGPLTMVAFVNAGIAQARASAERIAAVLARPAEVDTPEGDGPLPDAHRGRRLELRAVATAHLPALDLAVGPGEIVGLVAEPSAAQDLVAVLGRELDPRHGELRLDGVPAGRLPVTDFRREVLVERHDGVLFRGPVRENVAAGRARPTAPAMAAAAADEVVDALPDGADSDVGERGQALSGGQRQRVALARALAADAPVLVLHEPTTAVDSVTEARIAGGVRGLRADRTTLLVTSSPTLLAATDRVVLVLADGTTAHGRHAELLERHAAYRAVVSR
ncbi:ABC transporter transmembrane domain-containing protein [Pseudonocardia humida]|uniref:ABC transporter ATP-binding protein n=1 Tax=Pseudonocardia humida TaxID=2800819 RepID=A0ABT1A233_9PSEU|nr:ABC transporter ATP-binding protein [Pseudonocardia humida]MCO1657052.1 ABC transporter ATP-binding protein [Pseudonocardia humida]